MANEVMDWDGAYSKDGDFEGVPPWNIGEPQPELAALLEAGTFRSEVLDAGCGHAELSLALAAANYTVHGIDLTASAVAAASAAAAQRGLGNATFEQADITTFDGHDGRFNTVVDSTLFHSLPVENRDGYLRAIHRAAAPGAGYYVLVFAKGAFADESDTKPNEVDEDELRAAVAQHWDIDEIRPAFIHAYAPVWPDQSQAMYELPPHPDDGHGRLKFPAYLLSAHKN